MDDSDDDDYHDYHDVMGIKSTLDDRSDGGWGKGQWDTTGVVGW